MNEKEINQTHEEISLNVPRICPNCGSSIPIDARICPYCKKDFEQTIQNVNKINSSFVAGIISAIFLIIEIFLLVLALSMGIFAFGFGDIIIIAGLGYIGHKTLLKRQRLTTWEWVGFVIVIIWFLIAFLIGFMIGYASGF